MTQESLVETGKLVNECAENPALFYHTFFPYTFRQGTPAFHHDIFRLLDDPRERYVAFKCFRGSAKTTVVRAYAARRIAYGISRTIVLVSASQEFAEHSLKWIRRLFESRRGRLWRETFGLARGPKWTNEVLEIEHQVLDAPITVLALGITGQTRGINIDDYRPDLIIVDDPSDEESVGTPEQRAKQRERFFGSLQNNLAPETECPEAKMALLQTPLAPDDLIHTCERDPMWTVVEQGCFDEHGRSVWEERFPTEVLQKRKQAYSDNGQLPLWLREMEVRIVASEDADFRPEWLQHWDILPEPLATYIGVDPVPPPSERALQLGLKRHDFEAIAVVGTDGERYFLCDYALSRGHEPEWTIANFFRLVDRWRPLKAVVESTAYQRTLRWILEQAMKERKRYVQIDELDDRRKKRHRIQQAFSGIGSQGLFFVHKSHTEFAEQFMAYPNTAHDDLLDAAAIALVPAVENVALAEDDIFGEGETMEEWRSAP
jgi:phage terminase large subunit-like protein